MHRLAFAIVLPAKGKTACKRGGRIGPPAVSRHPKREKLVAWRARDRLFALPDISFGRKSTWGLGDLSWLCLSPTPAQSTLFCISRRALASSKLYRSHPYPYLPRSFQYLCVALLIHRGASSECT